MGQSKSQKRKKSNDWVESSDEEPDGADGVDDDAEAAEAAGKSAGPPSSRTRHRKQQRRPAEADEGQGPPGFTVTIGTKPAFASAGRLLKEISGRPQINWTDDWEQAVFGVKATVGKVAKAMLDRRGLSLEGAAWYYLHRDAAGKASFRKPPMALDDEDDWMLAKQKAMYSNDGGGPRRRSDAKDKGMLHFAIQLSAGGNKPTVTKAAAPGRTQRRTTATPTPAGTTPPGSEQSELQDTQEQGEETLLPIRVKQVCLRLPVVQMGGTLATVCRAGDPATKVVATKKTSTLVLEGKDGELKKLTKIVDGMIGKLGEASEVRSSHYNIRGATFVAEVARKSDEGIQELASSLDVGELVERRKGGSKKTHVEIAKLFVSKPASASHPYVTVATEDGANSDTEASLSQPGASDADACLSPTSHPLG
jgi:hypothetical protein